MNKIKQALGRIYRMSQSNVFFWSVVFFILVFRWVGWDHFVVPSGSMIPTFLVLDHIVVKKHSYGFRVPFTKKWFQKIKNPHRGDVVVFRSKDASYFMVKRVIGIEGDQIRIENQKIWINQKLVPTEEWNDSVDNTHSFYAISSEDVQDHLDRYHIQSETLGGKTYRVLWKKEALRMPALNTEVPPGHVFALGDNRNNSQDSRYWGMLPMTHLIGKAVGIWLSCSKSLFSLPILCYPWTFRTDRMFSPLDQKLN